MNTEFLSYVEPALKLLVLLLAITWWFFSNRTKAKKLAKALELAKKDIQFLLMVEREYGEELRFYEGSSQKNNIRARVKQFGYQWSGKYTIQTIENSKSHSEMPSQKQSLIETLLK